MDWIPTWVAPFLTAAFVIIAAALFTYDHTERNSTKVIVWLMTVAIVILSLSQLI